MDVRTPGDSATGAGPVGAPLPPRRSPRAPAEPGQSASGAAATARRRRRMNPCRRLAHLLTLALAMLLAVATAESWPAWLGWLRPVWVALVLFYWVDELRTGSGSSRPGSWALVDVLQADPLGLNGALLAGITFRRLEVYERCDVCAGAAGRRRVPAGSSVPRPSDAGARDRRRPRAVVGVLGPPTSLLAWPFVALLLRYAGHRFRVVYRGRRRCRGCRR